MLFLQPGRPSRFSHTLSDMQHATCNMQHAACSMQHAACNMQHATCNRQQPIDDSQSMQQPSMLSRSDGLTCTAQDSAAALTRQTQDAIIAARAQARSGCRTRPTWSGPSGGTACSLGTRRGCGSRTGALQRTHGPVQRVATQAQPDATRCDGSQRIARGRTTLRGGAARRNSSRDTARCVRGGFGRLHPARTCGLHC